MIENSANPGLETLLGWMVDLVAMLWLGGLAYGLLFLIFCMHAASRIAGEKGYATIWAYIAAVFFGPVAILYYVGLPDRAKETANEWT